MCKGMSDDECEQILESIPDFDKLHKRRTSEEVQALLDSYLSGDSDGDTETTKYGGGSSTSSVDDALNSLMD